MNKRGQLVQIFEIVGTIIVILGMALLAQGFGSGENFFKLYIAQDLALTVDALYINPGGEIELDYLLEADQFGYEIAFEGNPAGGAYVDDDYVVVRGGKIFEKNRWVFFRVENLLMDQVYYFAGKDHQLFDDTFQFDSPKMLKLTHTGELGVEQVG